MLHILERNCAAESWVDLLKVTVGSLALAAVALLALTASGPPLSRATITMTRLETARSLGGGQLGADLRSSDRLVAIRAALAIGRTKQPQGVALLRPFAASGDLGLRAMAVYGIGLIGGRQAVVPTLSALHDAHDVVRVAALDAADRLGMAHAFSRERMQRAASAIAALLHASNPVVRARAATASEIFAGTPLGAQAAAALDRTFLRERSADVRWHVLWTLGRWYAKETPRSIVVRGLRDPDSSVRIEAVRVLGHRGIPNAAALLAPMTKDASWRVQEQAIEALRIVRGQPPTIDLKTIPAIVRTPRPQADPYARLRALARAPKTPLQKPDAAGIITVPPLDPASVATLTGPARGPHPRMRIVTTKGNVYVELYPEWAPLTVENFLHLANDGYYDGNPWFRIVPDFVVQSGDPSANAKGPGYTIPAEENPIEQQSYVLSMGLDYTRPPNPHAIRDSAGSEFYITLSPQLHLDRDFTVFGRVIAGKDVLGRLVESDKILRIERISNTKR